MSGTSAAAKKGVFDLKSNEIDYLAERMPLFEGDRSRIELGESVLFGDRRLEYPTVVSWLLWAFLMLTLPWPILCWAATYAYIALARCLRNWDFPRVRAHGIVSFVRSTHRSLREESKTNHELMMLLARGPKHISIFDMTKRGNEVRTGVTTSRALSAVYSWSSWRVPKLRLADILDWIWVANNDEAKAVRNRLVIVEEKLYSEMCLSWFRHGFVRILIGACGSGDADLTALARFKRDYPDVPDDRISVHLVDLSDESLRSAGSYAISLGLQKYVSCFPMKISDYFEKHARPNGWTFSIVEEVGWLDYRSDHSFVKNCAVAWEFLVPGGVFISAHIMPTKSKLVVRWWIGWPGLIRRTPEEYRRLLVLSGCGWIKLTIEPCRTYVIAECRKE